jgi:hypothetical protein
LNIILTGAVNTKDDAGLFEKQYSAEQFVEIGIRQKPLIK